MKVIQFVGFFVAFCILSVYAQEPSNTHTYFAAGPGQIQEFQVPTGVYQLLMAVWGAGGKAGCASEDKTGGFVKYVLYVTPGETIRFVIGISGECSHDTTTVSQLESSNWENVVSAGGSGAENIFGNINVLSFFRGTDSWDGTSTDVFGYVAPAGELNQNGLLSIQYDSWCEVPPGATEAGFTPELDIPRSGLFVLNNIPTLSIVLLDIPNFYTPEFTFPACTTTPSMTPDVTNCSATFQVDMPNYNQDCSFELTEADSKFTLTGILSVSINWNYTDPFFQITEPRTYSFPLEWFVELDQTVNATSALCVPHDDITSEVLPSVAVCHYMPSATIETDCLSIPDDPESPLVTYIGCDCLCPSSSGELCEVPSPTVECASTTLELTIDSGDESACSKVNHKLPLVLLSDSAEESSLGSVCSYSSCPFNRNGDQAIGLRRTITGATSATVLEVTYPDLAILDIEFSIGVSTVTYEIFDLNGKTESFSITITVTDEVPCCCDISPPSNPTGDWSLDFNLHLESKCDLGMYGTRTWADWGTFRARDNYASSGEPFDLQLSSVYRLSEGVMYLGSEAPEQSGVYRLVYVGLESTDSQCICQVDLYYHKEIPVISGYHGEDYEQELDRVQDDGCDTSNSTTYNAEYSCPAPGAVDGKSVTVSMSTDSTGPLQLQVTNGNTPHSFPLICTDCLGGEVHATDYVTVIDRSCPCVVCSAINVNQDCDSSDYDCSVDINLAEYCTALDNFDGDITSTGFGSPRSVEMSVTYLRVDVVDTQGNTCGIDVPITVTETCQPKTGCPDDIDIHVEQFNQNCEGTPAFSHSTYSTEDNCDPNPTTTNSYDFDAMYSLSSSPHEFTYTSTDASENIGTCVTIVTLHDEHGPWISTGGSVKRTSGSLTAINVELGSECNSATVAYDLSLDFADNCDSDEIIAVEYTINSSPTCRNGGPERVVNEIILRNGGQVLPLVMDVRLTPYSISIKASDSNGNENTWSQVINIVDVTPSVITVTSTSRSRQIQTDACKNYATKSHEDVLSDFGISICDNSNTEVTSITRSPEDDSNPTHHHVGTTVVYTISVVDCAGLSSTETVEYIVGINCGDYCVGELENCEPVFNGDNEPVLCDPNTCTCASSYTPEQGCGPDGSPATTGVCQGPATIPGCTVTVNATTAPSVEAIIHMDQIYSTTAVTRTTSETSPIDYVDYYLEFKAHTVSSSDGCEVQPQNLATDEYLSFTSCCDETCDKDMQAFVYNTDASLIETTVDHCNRLGANHKVLYDDQTHCYTFPVCVTNTPIVVGRRVNETDFICKTPSLSLRSGSVTCPVLGTSIKASVCGNDHQQTFASFPCVVDFLWNDEAVFELDQGFSYQFGLSNQNPLVMGLTGTIDNVDSVFTDDYDQDNKRLSHSFPKGQSEVAYKFSNCLNNYHQCPVSVLVLDECPPLTNIWAVAGFVVPDIPSECYTEGVPCGYASSEGSYRTGCTAQGCEGLNTFECANVFEGPCTFVIPAHSSSNTVAFEASDHLPCFKDNCDSDIVLSIEGNPLNILTFDTTTMFSFTARDESNNVGSFSYKVKVADYTKPILNPKGDFIDVCAADGTTFYNIALDSGFQSSYEASDNVNTQAELLWEFIPNDGAYPITCNDDDVPSTQEVIVSDLSYNSVHDEFNVKVLDCQSPVITAPPINSNCLSEPRVVKIAQTDSVTFSISILRKIDEALKSEIQYVTVTDNDLANLNFIVQDSLGNLLSPPFVMDLSCDTPITFTFVASDCHNTVSQDVSVVSTCSGCMPTCSFTSPALGYATTNCLCCAQLDQAIIDNGVSGQNGNNEVLEAVRITSTETCFPLGETTVSYKVTDLFGNEGFCEYTVTVTDQETPRTNNSCTPAEECPEDRFVFANDAFCVTDANVCHYSPDYPIYRDNCGNPTHSRWATEKTEMTVFDPTQPLSSATLTCGLNTFSFEAKDASNNVSPECSYSVTVEPDIPFVCSGLDPFQEINDGLCSESCPACTIDDQVHTIPATSSAGECVSGVGVNVDLVAYAYCGGVTTLSAQYVPGQENSGVSNSVAPLFSGVSGFPESCVPFAEGEDSGRNGVAVFTETNPLVGSIHEQWNFPYSAFPYTVRYNAKGTGQYPKEKSGSFKVTVNDVVPPTIVTCSSAAPVRVCAYGGVSARATFTAPELFDNTCHPTLFTYAANGNAVHSMDTLFPVGTTTVMMTAYDFAGNTNSCSFEVVVLPPVPEAKSSAVLTRVYISKANATHYKAQLKIATYVTNPHRVYLDGASSVNELSAEEGQPTGCDSSNSDGSTNCKQIWDADYYIFGCVLPSTNLVLKTSINNLQGCDSVNDMSTSCGSEIATGETTSHGYTSRPNNLNIVLNANNFCAKELSKVRLVAYIRTVNLPEYSGFLLSEEADLLTPGASITFPDSLTTAVPQSALSSLVIINQTAVGALVKTVALQKFEKVYFNDQARSFINTTLLILDNTVMQSPYAGDTNFAVENYAQFAAMQHKELAVTSFPQPTFYVTLKATVSVTYLLGSTSRRRLLSLVQKDIKQSEQTTAASRRRVSYLEEKTASAVANHVALSLDSVPTTAFSDGGSGLALVVIRLSSSMTDSAVLAAAVVNAVVNALSMPAKSVEAYVVPNSQSGSTSLVQLVYKQTLSTITLSGSQFASSVQKQLSSSSSALSSSLTSAMITTDPDFFYVGVVKTAAIPATSTSTTSSPTTTVISTDGSSGFSSSSVIIIAVIAAGVVACIAATIYAVRVRSAHNARAQHVVTFHNAAAPHSHGSFASKPSADVFDETGFAPESAFSDNTGGFDFSEGVASF